jgi:signal transduction histidine kinase
MTALRSTPLRLTGILIVIFAAFTVAGYGAAFLVTRAALTRDVAARLEQTVETIRSIPEQDEIVERAAEIAAGAVAHDILRRYTVPGGPTIGNLREPVEVVSGAIIGHADLPLAEDAVADSYLAWQGAVGRGTLTLLVGRDSLTGLRETFSTVLLLNLVPALLLATVAGTLVARSARDRVEAIRTTLAQLTSGLTGARVPVPRDVADDLGQIALAVNQMAEAQEASIEALRQVSADIAHDLKTPIQRVAVLLDRLEGTTLTGPAREIIAAARAETAQIVETFRALLQIAQLEGGQARSGLADLDFAALVADLADVYGPASEESGHLLTTAIDGPAIVKGDRTLLGRLVANLIENALRHTPPGRILLHLAGGPSPVLTVSDEGPGIPEAERERVFRRLYRLERSRTSEGSGLGLSLVAAIAELHGARLKLGDASPGLIVTVSFGA